MDKWTKHKNDNAINMSAIIQSEYEGRTWLGLLVRVLQLLSLLHFLLRIAHGNMNRSLGLVPRIDLSIPLQKHR